LSVTAPPRPAPAPARGEPPSRRPSAAQLRRRALALGVALVLLMVAAVGLILESFGGTFASYVVVQAELPASATAVALNAPVEYRNVTVGTVASQGRQVPGGLVSLTLHLDPSMLGSIPAGVSATEAPESFFGDPYLVLEPPATAGGAALQAGATIPALTTGPTASLQSTLGDLDALLVGLHPAELDAALTALAGAIQGQGASLGKNLDAGNAYLVKMLPLWPTVVTDLRTLVPVADTLSSSAQSILTILSSQTTTGRTIDTESSQVQEAIGGGAALAAQLSSLLQEIQQPYAVLAADAGSFLQAASQSPTEIQRLLAGLDEWAKTWTAAESSGPYLDLQTDVVVANPADLGLAVLGGPDVVTYLSGGLGSGYVNPATYSSAGTIGAGTVASAESAAAAAPPVLPAQQETQAVSEIAAAVGGHPPDNAAVATLLLQPLLSEIVARR
jgi:phospholipid/cholesterol/gamma-HCH transport system substrate-binding protein